jgi:hypothetical protein
LSNGLQFIEEDQDGMKMRVRTEFLGGEFPYEIGYLVISSYDDRKYVVTKVDQENQLLWFGMWEE